MVGSWKTTFLLERPIFRCYVSGMVRDPGFTSCYISNPMETMVLLSICLHIRCMIAYMKSINYLRVILTFPSIKGMIWHDGHEIKTPMFACKWWPNTSLMTIHCGINKKITWHHGDQSTMCWTFHFHRVAQTSEDPYTATVCFHQSTIFMLHHPCCDPEVGWSIAV